MIYIEKNKTNRVVLTLNEKSEYFNSTAYTNYYLFEFVKTDSNDSTLFNPVSISANTLYNVFDIIDNATINLTGGTVNLIPGFYDYTIYEQTSQYNLSITGTTGNIVEVGKALVKFPLTNDVAYTGGTNNNIIYYQ